MEEEFNVEPGAADASEVRRDTPGAKLVRAREAQGLSIQDVAARTRIAQRQLEAIERDDYAALPGIPYAVGFARAYARAVDLDEVEIAADVRSAVHDSDIGANRYEAFEPADPKRVPSRALAWTAAIIVILLVAGFTLWRTQLMTPPTGEEIAQEQAAPAAAKPSAARPVAPASLPVIFTAVDDVWMRIYDDAGERLKDGLMKKGDSFTLPANARNPMIVTGRPQALTITVGGKPMPPLGPADRTVADVPVSAEALLARASGVQQPAAAPATVTPSAPAAARPRPVRSGPPAARAPDLNGQGPSAASPASPPPAPVATPEVPSTAGN